MTDDAVAMGLDVVAIGSALVDVLVQVSDERLVDTGLVKGSMALVDLAQAEELYRAAGPAVEASGGSAANTVAGVANLGGAAGFVGKVADDLLGQVFSHDIRASGVEYVPVHSPDLGTGRCLIMVTEDAERTMATYLGAAVSLRPEDLPDDLIGRGRILYLEGYLWDLPAAKQAMRQGIAEAHAADGAVALSLSDSFCVERHRRDFLDLLVDDVDVLFGNEEEIMALFAARSFEAALDACEETGLLVAVTRGAEGSVVITERGPIAAPAAPATQVLDTTGAGDLYAAGFLYALARGGGPDRCAELGSVCAAEVISHLGGRPQQDLRALAQQAGLLEGLR
jgi:sugar/nucleoside kinase (ribokinase family)